MKLDQWLAKSKTSQAEFAKAIGLTQSMVSHLVRGRCAVTPENALKIAAATGYEVRPHDVLPSVYPFPGDGIPPGVLSA